MGCADAVDADAADPGKRIRELTAAVAAARQRLDAGQAVDLSPLRHLLADLPAPAPDGAAKAPEAVRALLGLLDELMLLAQVAERERSLSLQQLRALVRHRRADAAYAVPGSRP
ncbi:hypothetical protein [Benzoatithermus flavus]|uniref:Uncharacterized protein n=1 Tax=Benzoatithermus flavus TaxID=3108223 RepID=A0ABU8XPT2_9PROT